MTDQARVRRYLVTGALIAEGTGEAAILKSRDSFTPYTEVVLAADFDRVVGENVMLTTQRDAIALRCDELTAQLSQQSARCEELERMNEGHRNEIAMLRKRFVEPTW